MQKTSKIFHRIFFLVIFLMFSGFLNAANVITSLDFSVSRTASTAKIGDTVYFTMAVIDASNTYSDLQPVTATASAAYVYGENLPATPPSGANPYFVYNGKNTWEVTSYTPNPEDSSQDTLAINNSNLIAGSTVSSYTSLKNATFKMASGSRGTGGSASVDIGSSVMGIGLYDSGDFIAHNDLVINDGIYNGKFLVRESYQFNVEKGSITGRFSEGGVNAESVESPKKISLDSIRPKIQLANAHPNPYNPNKELFELFYYLTESCDTQIEIYTDAMVSVKTITVDGLSGYNEPVFWDGLDSSGVLQADGRYTYEINITDKAGNTGSAYSGDLIITTVEVKAKTAAIDTHYSSTEASQVVVALDVDVELFNATDANLANLGFDPAVYGANSYKLYPYVMIDVKLYDSSGTQLQAWPKDLSPITDRDRTYHTESSNPAGYRDLDYTENPLPQPACGVDAGGIYTTGDGDEGNDWDLVFGSGYMTQAGGGYYHQSRSLLYHSAEMEPGTYIAAVKGILVGKSVVLASDEIGEGTDECTEETYFYWEYHVQPSFFFDETTSVITDLRGWGINSLDAQGNADTAGFIVEEEQIVPGPDNTAPRIVENSAYPEDGSVIKPDTITSSNPVKVTLVDDGVGAGSTNKSKFILKDPYGNNVEGSAAWNAGTPDTKMWDIYFVPDDPIALGGDYSFTVIPVDAANNIGSPETYSFSVEDKAIPKINSVKAYSDASNPPETLSEDLSTEISFTVSKIEATIISGGTADVDFDKTTISIEDSGGNVLQGETEHTEGTNVISFTPSSILTDGSYTVNIKVVSETGSSGTEGYDFYVQTEGITYIDSSGEADTPGPTTYMIINLNDVNNSGISDNSGNTNLAASVLNVSEITMPGSAPATYETLGEIFRFSVDSPYTLPVNFGAAFSTVAIRLHYSESDLSTLAANGLDPSDLSVWVYDGTEWTQITSGISGPNTGTGNDYYFEYSSVSSIQPDNAYALMYQAPEEPAAPDPVYIFKSTKAFDPAAGKARIYYTDDISDVAGVKAYIYTTAGVLVRKDEFADASETALFTNEDINPYDSSDSKYYYSWDGANDTGGMLRNGVYIIRIETTKTDGSKENITRMTALVK
ncbi:MAG: hypothetical protein ACLFP1_02110 [Candidatus Goldiibacteriota bacterium]